MRSALACWCHRRPAPTAAAAVVALEPGKKVFRPVQSSTTTIQIIHILRYERAPKGRQTDRQAGSLSVHLRAVLGTTDNRKLYTYTYIYLTQVSDPEILLLDNLVAA